MTHNNCFYINCTNTTKTHSMFRFPINDKKRMKLWIKNSGNTAMVPFFTKDKWRNCYLCEEHFDPESIHRNKTRDRLIGPAIPLKWKLQNKNADVISPDPDTPDIKPRSPEFKLKVLPPQRVYQKRPCHTLLKAESCSSQNSSQSKQDLNMSSSKNQIIDQFCMDVKCVGTRELLQVSRKAVRKQSVRITWFREKLSNENLHQRQFPSVASKIIASMQFAFRPEQKKWNEDEKCFSLALFNKSPACYRLMLSKGIVLPSVNTINRWLSESTGLTEVAEDCSYVKKERYEDFDASVKELEDVDMYITEKHEEDYGTRVKEEREADCASVHEQGEEDYDVSRQCV